MRGNEFKPVSIVSTTVESRRELVELLRSWAETLPPQTSFEVQYTYDPNSKTRGFHLLFRESAAIMVARPADPAKETQQEEKPLKAA